MERLKKLLYSYRKHPQILFHRQTCSLAPVWPSTASTLEKSSPWRQRHLCAAPFFFSTRQEQ